jgi:hypothetical protein
MTPIRLSELNDFLFALRELRCWYVSTGGSAGPTFQLALGGKIQRHEELTNSAHTDEFRRFEGEANLLVWCTWRLDGPEGPLTSADDTPENIAERLALLVGERVVGVAAINQAGDLRLRMSNRLTLRVFCDHVGSDPSFDGNWELWDAEQSLFVGPGKRMEIVAREMSPSGRKVVTPTPSIKG